MGNQHTLIHPESWHSCLAARFLIFVGLILLDLEILEVWLESGAHSAHHSLRPQTSWRDNKCAYGA